MYVLIIYGFFTICDKHSMLNRWIKSTIFSMTWVFAVYRMIVVMDDVNMEERNTALFAVPNVLMYVIINHGFD